MMAACAAAWRVAACACVVWLPLLPLGYAKKNYGKKRDLNGPYSHIVSPLPHEDMELVRSLPSTWDWRNVNGSDFTSPNLAQHQPGQYCGACYAFAAIGHLNDRFNVARKNAWPKTRLSVQMLISCGSSMPKGCQGGDVSAALKFIHEYGVTDETCANYESKDLKCNAMAVCQDCMTGFDPVCRGREKFPVYRVQEYGQILPKVHPDDSAVISAMVVQMKAEIWKRGPIVCQVACPDPVGGVTGIWGHSRGYMDDYTPFFNDEGNNFKPFVLHDRNYTCAGGNWDQCVDHDVVVSGWGSDNGTPYWLVRNSWGSWWGEGGWFRIVMGLNNLGIESRCDFGVPAIAEEMADGSPPMSLFGTPSTFKDRFALADHADSELIIQYM